jgi:hypothetical protein
MTSSLRRKVSHPQKKLSDKQEQRTAEQFGGTVNPGSGSGWRRPQDVRVGRDLLIENKRTGKKGINIKATDWEQLRRNALSTGRMPLMSIELDGVDYVMVRQVDWEEKCGEL